MFNFNHIRQADCAKILTALTALDDSFAMYIVNKDQGVVHWSWEMENLLAIRKEQAIDQPCIEGLSISELSDNKDELIKLSAKNDKVVEVKKHTLVLHDKNGTFVAGLGLLQVNNESTALEFVKNTLTLLDENFYGILSRAPTMEPVFQLIQNAATTEVTVLVRGESGSGKELVAKAIHQISARNKAPFLAINCAALSSNLLESELFGHARGAFTGAIKDHKGLFQRADGGTLFLDEVAEMPLELQAKLLRVLQEKSFIPVGGDHAIDVDVRIVAATHRAKGVAIFAKACFGHPSPSKRQKLNATAIAFGAPAVLRTCHFATPS